jgi:hypothetical protein
MPGWNYTVRLYRPRAETLNGKMDFPAGAVDLSAAHLAAKNHLIAVRAS